jgi:hypothetical protein
LPFGCVCHGAAFSYFINIHTHTTFQKKKIQLYVYI